MEHETKALTFELKASERGKFSAIFATLNVIDLHGDVTLPGAFTDGAEVLIGGWDHAPAGLPVGKGAIREDGNLVRVEGGFFLDTPHGEAAYRTVKAAGSVVQWSYVFRVLDASFGEWPESPGQSRDVRFLKALDVWSVDPVGRGAGIGTRTTRVKGAASRGAGSSPAAKARWGQRMVVAKAYRAWRAHQRREVG